MVTFNEFEPTSFTTWKEKVVQDLKGKDYNENLSWNAGESIRLDPYFDSSNSDGHQYITNFFKELSFPKWKLYEEVSVQNPGNGNQKALNALSNGCDGIIFNCEIELSKSDFNNLLSGLIPEICDISLKGSYAGQYHDLLNETLEEKNQALRGGYLFANKTSNTNLQTFVIQNSIEDPLESLRGLLIEYVNAIEENAGSRNSIFFNISVGDHFYEEIARIRALRFLVDAVQRNKELKDIYPAIIHATPMPANDYKSTMLRNAASGLACVVAGVNSIHFDLGADKPESFAKRIARNTGNLLREESKLVFEKDPVAGNYLLDHLTHRYCEAVWKEL